MNNITYAVSVDVNNPIIPYNVYVANVLDSSVRYLEITLYQNGNVIALSNEATATASLVTDNVLVDDSVECTISNNIISVPLEDLQRHGNLDVQVTVTEGEKVLAIPFPIQVRVTPNIAEEAQIDENSMGSYAEVVQEIAEARNGYDSLDERLNSIISGSGNVASVKDYGAKGDGETDDTAAIKQAIEENNLVIFPEGEYLTNGGVSVANLSDRTLWARGAEVKFDGNGDSVFHFANCDNINIVGGTYKGMSKAKYGLNFVDSKNVSLDGVSVQNVGNSDTVLASGINFVGDCSYSKLNDVYIDGVTSGQSDGSYIFAHGIGFTRSSRTGHYSKYVEINHPVIKNVGYVGGKNYVDATAVKDSDGEITGYMVGNNACNANIIEEVDGEYRARIDGDGVFIVQTLWKDPTDAHTIHDGIESYFKINNVDISHCSKRALKIAARCVDVDGGEIDVATWSAAVEVQRVRNNSLRNLNITDTTYTPVTINGGDGLMVIENCRITGGGMSSNGSGGIVLGAKSSGLIEGSEIVHIKNCVFDNTRYPIYAAINSAAAGKTDCEELVIKDCRIKHFYGDAAVFLEAGRFKRLGNLAIENVSFLYGDSGREVFKANNDFYNNSISLSSPLFKVMISPEESIKVICHGIIDNLREKFKSFNLSTPRQAFEEPLQPTDVFEITEHLEMTDGDYTSSEDSGGNVFTAEVYDEVIVLDAENDFQSASPLLEIPLASDIELNPGDNITLSVRNSKPRQNYSGNSADNALLVNFYTADGRNLAFNDQNYSASNKGYPAQHALQEYAIKLNNSMVLSKLAVTLNFLGTGTVTSGTELRISVKTKKLLDVSGMEAVFDAVVRNYQDVTPDITFDIHNTAIATYLTESAVYSPNDYDVTKVPTSLSGTPYDTPNTTTIDLPTGSSKVILYDTVAKTEQVISVSGSTYTITNLIPNRVYAYTVRNSSGTMLSYGTVKATGHIRMIDGGGNTFNIRDLGGWTCDGGKTKYGLIYRGAELNGAVSLNSSQVDFFKNVLGIRDEIDLRNPTSTGVGSGALGLGVDYVNIYINYSPYALQDLYRQKRVDIIKRIAKNIKEKKVTYIHCSAGADRTAIICTFIEAICGVSQNDIDRDYELTAFAYDTNNNRLSTRTRNSTWLNGHRVMINGDGTETYSYPYINNMEGSSFQDKIVRFLLRSGVTIDELNDIRFGLIDGNPTALTNPYGNATITKNLSHVFIDNEDTSVKLYQPFEARVLPNDGYILTSVSVAMGGTDITSTAYNAERILIPKVTGDIIITASATDVVIPDVSGKADKATTLEGYGINDAYTKAEVDALENNKEDKSNKVQSIGSMSQTFDNNKYPSVTAVRDYVNIKTDDLKDYIEDELDGLDEAKADKADTVLKESKLNKVTEITANSTDAQYPSALAVYNAIQTALELFGYNVDDILGLHADFENKVFSRLGAAVRLTAGQDFNAFPMYGGRRRCNVANDGTINAYYGDEGYTEDGTNGQVMVYQPAFYYKVVPLKLEKNTSGVGYHIRKANYYVSSSPKVGFKRHPLFYDEQGNPVDYVLLSAYEGSMYDVSEEAYVNDSVDTSVAYGAGDLLCSVAGKKPIGGKLSGVGTKANFETMAHNIGSGWHLNTIKAESANQLLMMIELGSFNTQAAIGQGVVSCPNNGSYNCSSYTGSTASLGNATGMATETTYESAGTEKLSVTYRGVENPWGNIWKHTNGINLWGDGHMGGGQVFICDDFSFNESKHDGNYQSAGFTISNGGGYVSAFGYGDEDYDWLFMPSETTGNSSLPVGDNFWAVSVGVVTMCPAVGISMSAVAYCMYRPQRFKEVFL